MPTFLANDGSVQHVAASSLRRVLGALGFGCDDPATAARDRRAALWREVVPPVAVSWLPGRTQVALRLPIARSRRARIEVLLEDGGSTLEDFETDALATLATRDVNGRNYRRARLTLTNPLPEGYHRARLQIGGETFSFLWIVAPRTAHPVDARTCGLFVPLYALHSERRPDCGDLTDWCRLAEWAGDAGVRLMGTLPLCAAFLEDPVEPSPYAPVSRMYWNEIYVDDARLPELAHTGAPSAAPAARSADWVDWPEVARARRQALAACAEHFFSTGPGEADPGLAAFVTERPDVERFALFRAAQRQFGRNWRAWPEPMRDGALSRSDADTAAFQHHLYAQWRTQQQIDATLDAMRAHGCELYLDLPLGVHPDGYDAWAYRDEFLGGCSAGAPPDPFFTLGQDWGFAPLHPHASRVAGHRYFRDCLRHQLAHCGVLRIDHVMGLHRTWCVPHGEPADRGVYVRQPGDELFAILTLESRRRRCAVVGEDLGTVPAVTQRALEDHGVVSMHVVQFEAAEDSVEECLTPSAGHLAALNTHDMPPFASWWTASDVGTRVDLGLLDEAGAITERTLRARLVDAFRRWIRRERPDAGNEEATDALQVILETLAHGATDIVVIGLEDLWGELRPQNVPGTTWEQSRNWQRRTRPTLEEVLASPELRRRIGTIVRARTGDRHGRP